MDEKPRGRWSNANKFADRGKFAEKQVQAFLDQQSEMYADFAFERLPDARAARGAFKAMAADFDLGIGHLRVAAFLEVKETKHNYRINKDKLAQLPRLRKWAMAGRKFAVLVYHSELDGWRLIPQGFFGMEGMPASWDISDITLHSSAAAALRDTGWFR